MLLQQITLTNIRSYTNQTVNFQKGSILLSGDIGSGKSSLLLAIEFALFGTSRPDLPAEALLRKGTTKGSVQLQFILNKQKIIIQRNLKKEKDSIKQTAGYIIINDLKKELTAIELKAEIINLLGYPEDLITKNKNYIFRYTVYTPQEGMKLILNENAEVRQDVLRRIFNIDKYKKIRENLYICFRKMRINIAVLETKAEPLQENKQLLDNLHKEKSLLLDSLQILLPQLEIVQGNTKNLQKKQNELEDQQNLFQLLKQQQETNQVMLKEKQQQILTLEQQDEMTTLKIADLKVPLELSLEKVKEDLNKLETEKNSLFTKKTTIQEKLNLLQVQLVEGKEEISRLETSLLDDKEAEKVLLIASVNKKLKISEEKNNFSKLIEQTSMLITKNTTLSEQARETHDKITSLENCPTCLQIVSDNHKLSITTQQKNKIDQAEKSLVELRLKKSQQTDQKTLLEKELEEISGKEKLLSVINIEIQQLQENKLKSFKKKQELKSKLLENNDLILQLAKVQEQEKNFSNDKREEMKKIMDMFLQKDFLEKQAEEFHKQITETKTLLINLTSKQQEINNNLKDKQDCSNLINENKLIISKVINEEKELAISKASFETQLNSYNAQEKALQNKIAILISSKDEAKELKKLQHWLEDFFFPLTHTIEKQIMVNIHHSFNQLFQEWFSMLIDDDNISARIDDTFTPVIEQNGYEILFNNLSGGEKTSAALAYRLALNRVINDVIHDIKTKDLLILDEPTDGFSSEQLDKVRDVLERLQLEQTIIVSHESKIESFVDTVIRIEKEGQVSSVNTH